MDRENLLSNCGGTDEEVPTREAAVQLQVLDKRLKPAFRLRRRRRVNQTSQYFLFLSLAFKTW